MTIFCTRGCLTTSLFVSFINAISSTLDKTLVATSRPDTVSLGRSFCVISPVTTTFEPNPIRVRNIFICAGVVFCASSRIINALSNVLPRIYARGILALKLSAPIIWKSASYRGLRYGSTLLCKSPGRNPSFSPASIAGLVRIILLTSLFLNALIAIAIARYVLPVPAGPTPNTIILSLMASTYSFCPNVLGLIGLPAIVLHTVSESISISKSAFSSNDCAME